MKPPRIRLRGSRRDGAQSTNPERLCLTPARMLPGHRVQLFAGGAQAYPAMLAAIASARSEVLLETYLWASDQNGRRFLDAVCMKAQEGVRVRCVIDGAGSFGFSFDDAARLRAAGVRLSVFHPVGPWRKRWGWQVRDHRKLLIVDGRLAFAGGMNLGDDYAPVDWGGRGWNDVQAAVEGPVVGELVRLFEQSFRDSEPETWQPADEPPAPPAGPPVALHGATTRVQAIAAGRASGRRSTQRHLRFAIGAARERVWIEAAYFVPSRTLRRALRRAAGRGVDVRILVPRTMDVPGLAHASRCTWAPLLRAGVAIYEWLPGMLHAKTLCVDGVFSAVGSYNLDARSLLYNQELTLAVLDAPVAAALEQKFNEDLLRAEPVDPLRFAARGWAQKLKERFFYLFRTWL